jgi:hypothetical protein
MKPLSPQAHSSAMLAKGLFTLTRGQICASYVIILAFVYESYMQQ